jgi:Tfp pilus assembly protein PilN
MHEGAFDFSVNLGSVLTIASFIVAVTVYIVTGRSATNVLNTRLAMIDGQMGDTKTELKKITEILITQTAHTGRMILMEERQLAEGKRMDEMARRMNKLVEDNGH